MTRQLSVPAKLVLADGTSFDGWCCGAQGEATGEVCFNTSLTGYEEVVSDPSYAGQIVTMTYPHIGNYGVNETDLQNDRLFLKGLVVRDMCYVPSNYRSSEALPDMLERNGIVAIEGLDTRQLTRHIRDHGAQMGVISTTDLDEESLAGKARQAQGLAGRNLAAEVSHPQDERFYALDHEGRELARPRFRVVAYDCGIKRGILRGLRASGCEVHRVPWDTPADKVLAEHPDGIFLSNGPGDPEPVEATYEAVRQLVGKVPVFGICLGHQMLTLAAGGQIEKLPFGHHGGNQPVMNLRTGVVEITSQNHGFGQVFGSLGRVIPELSGGETEAHDDDLRFWSARRIAPVVDNERYGRIQLTHVNLNDGTPEGMAFLDVPAFSVQYHPEASPGPDDASYLFESFCRLMAGRDDFLDIDVTGGRTGLAYLTSSAVLDREVR